MDLFYQFCCRQCNFLMEDFMVFYDVWSESPHCS